MARSETSMISDEYHPIRIAASYSGLSVEIIRAWERRYQVVEPKRNSSGQRVYSNEDINRLTLLSQAVNAGRRIGSIAKLSDEELAKIIERDGVAAHEVQNSKRKSTAMVMEYFDMCVDFTHKLDMYSLVLTLERANDSLGTIFFIEDLIDPLISYMREECRRGTVSNIKRYWLIDALKSFLMLLSSVEGGQKRHLLACSTESDAELTALKAAVIAGSMGWRVVHLDTPELQEVIETLQELPDADAVIVSYSASATYDCVPNRLRSLHQSLRDLPRPLSHIPVIAQTVGAALPIVREIGALHCGSLRQLQIELEQLHTSS